MTNEEANLTIDYLKEMQKGYIEGEGYERHPLPEWYALDKAIEAVEQIRWIPCSERLPKDCGYFLVTVKIEIQDLKPYYEMRTAQFDGKDFDVGYIGDCFRVIAWQPRPEPYVPDINVGEMAESEEV